jgi:hypothetical protein
MTTMDDKPPVRDEAYWQEVLDRLDQRFAQGTDPGRVISANDGQIDPPATPPAWMRRNGARPACKGAPRGKKKRPLNLAFEGSEVMVREEVSE